MRLFLLFSVLMLGACGSDEEGSAFSGRSASPTSDDEGGSSSSGGGIGAEPPASGGLAGCDDQCQTMTLVVRKGEHVISFDRAQFGFDLDSRYPALHIEAYRGGAAACPDAEALANGDAPTHSLSLVGLPAPFDLSEQNEGSGVQVTLLDLVGDVVDGKQSVLSAKSVTVTPVAANLQPDAAQSFVAFDLRVEFDQGVVAEGHAFASHCTSLDAK